MFLKLKLFLVFSYVLVGNEKCDRCFCDHVVHYTVKSVTVQPLTKKSIRREREEEERSGRERGEVKLLLLFVVSRISIEFSFSLLWFSPNFSHDIRIRICALYPPTKFFFFSRKKNIGKPFRPNRQTLFPEKFPGIILTLPKPRGGNFVWHIESPTIDSFLFDPIPTN